MYIQRKKKNMNTRKRIKIIAKAKHSVTLIYFVFSPVWLKRSGWMELITYKPLKVYRERYVHIGRQHFHSEDFVLVLLSLTTCRKTGRVCNACTRRCIVLSCWRKMAL